MRNKDVLFFDVETNPVENFTNLNGLDKIHCISIYNPTLGRVITFSGDGLPRDSTCLTRQG